MLQSKIQILNLTKLNYLPILKFCEAYASLF